LNEKVYVVVEDLVKVKEKAYVEVEEVDVVDQDGLALDLVMVTVMV
jgi:hypothetical protein